MSIVKSGINCKGVYETGGSGVIIDSRDYYRAFYHTARQARHYILLAGWQFDSEVALLRGEEAALADRDVRFLHFLEELCEKSPDLEVYILAWDFSVIFSLEREWFQTLIFDWSTIDRLHFRFDGKHAVGATHHQKFVIVDGQIAFLGGMDICASRWDDRLHLEKNPLRVDADGTAYGGYHDIQSYHTGPVVKELIALFAQRWLDSGGDALIFPTVTAPLDLGGVRGIPITAGTVAVSRTQALNLEPPQPEIHEIRRLFIDAILSAQRLIYLENQYFSSQACYWALVQRMTAPERPKLQIVLVLPQLLPFTEELFLGVPQMRMLRALKRVAQQHGHEFRAYSSACGRKGERKMTFIHSKLLLVDDRFLTVGSANATNRSMGLDTEINVSWEAEEGEGSPLTDSLRTVRATLLAEHAGLLGEDRLFEKIEGVVSTLDTLADDPDCRLCHYAPNGALEESVWPEALEPIARFVDPEKPVLEEFVYENLSRYETSSLLKGVAIISQWLSAL
ncbi:phospholipase D-like domain-containing protein [Geomonas sp. RF6]|uniref:phospholipase D-like domain-containing protein n=1 Tax=Geomonas sp. RF6 TaxID=2897342 RepID=UPI001E5F15D7|nr:phospholipase D-like domain-containing protein [Geomonas sp. RF6]UFS69186.1 phospholipase D-like domain-containing protein [Geomonas sp. RF6]